MKTVIVDAGHGGLNPTTGEYMTPPTIGKYYVFTDIGKIHYEGVSNRKQAAALEEELSKRGYNIVRVYHEYIDYPLSKRASMANKVYGQHKDCLLVSLHSNAYGNALRGVSQSPRGYEVWTSPGNSPSDRLGELIIRNYSKKFKDIPLRADMSDGDYDKEAAFYMLVRTYMPAVIIENLFFTNIDDVKLLEDDNYHSNHAIVVADAIDEYYNNFYSSV